MVETIRKWAERKEARVFAGVLDAMDRMGPNIRKPALADVLAGMNSPDVKVAEAAWGAAQRFGSDGRKGAVPVLVGVVKGPNADAAAKAAGWIGSMGTNAMEAASVLQEAAASKDANLSKAATEALKKVQPAKKTP